MGKSAAAKASEKRRRQRLHEDVRLEVTSGAGVGKVQGQIRGHGSRGSKGKQLQEGHHGSQQHFTIVKHTSWHRLAIKERMKSLTRGHAEDIGSTEGIQSYRGHEHEGAIAGKCFCDHPVTQSLRDSCALRGACRARPMSV